jgi:hypothetical protein
LIGLIGLIGFNETHLTNPTSGPSHLILQDEILFFVNNTIPVILACPESLRCGGTDSGQAGMTLRFYFFNLFIRLIHMYWN